MKIQSQYVVNLLNLTLHIVFKFFKSEFSSKFLVPRYKSGLRDFTAMVKKFLSKAFLWLRMVVLMVVVTGSVNASWVEMTIEELVQGSELVVLGELVSLLPQPNGSFEVGTIRVEEVIMGNEDMKVVLLVIPTRDREIKVSTDIVYREGQKGLWFLRVNSGIYDAGIDSILYLADHPQRFQPAKNSELVQKYLRDCL